MSTNLQPTNLQAADEQTFMLQEDSSLAIIENPEGAADFNQTVNYIVDNKDHIQSLLHSKGAVLLRNFAIQNAKRMEKVMSQFGQGFLSYVDGNSPRTKLTSKVYTSTEYPPEYEISLHNELSYSHVFPETLFFCCQIAPKVAGHTTIADCRKVLLDMDKSIVEQFEKHNISYYRNLHNGLGFGPSWQETFETQDKGEVERYCAQADIDFKWQGESLHLVQTVPGIISHPVTGEKVWFCQADQFHPSNLPTDLYNDINDLAKGTKENFPTYVTFGNGQEIPLDMFREIQHTFARHTIRFPWHKGDLLIIDNVLTAHGRSAFSGPRKILVAMT